MYTCETYQAIVMSNDGTIAVSGAADKEIKVGSG
jgi:hypothetical protein